MYFSYYFLLLSLLLFLSLWFFHQQLCWRRLHNTLTTVIHLKHFTPFSELYVHATKYIYIYTHLFWVASIASSQSGQNIFKIYSWMSHFLYPRIRSPACFVSVLPSFHAACCSCSQGHRSICRRARTDFAGAFLDAAKWSSPSSHYSEPSLTHQVSWTWIALIVFFLMWLGRYQMQVENQKSGSNEAKLLWQWPLTLIRMFSLACGPLHGSHL